MSSNKLVYTELRLWIVSNTTVPRPGTWKYVNACKRSSKPVILNNIDYFSMNRSCFDIYIKHIWSSNKIVAQEICAVEFDWLVGVKIQVCVHDLCVPNPENLWTRAIWLECVSRWLNRKWSNDLGFACADFRKLIFGFDRLQALHQKSKIDVSSGETHWHVFKKQTITSFWPLPFYFPTSSEIWTRGEGGRSLCTKDFIQMYSTKSCMPDKDFKTFALFVLNKYTRMTTCDLEEIGAFLTPTTKLTAWCASLLSI